MKGVGIMRIQNIMRVVGQVILILASFIMVPFFFGILDEGVSYHIMHSRGSRLSIILLWDKYECV